MRRLIGQFVLKCVRAYENSPSPREGEPNRSVHRSQRSLEDRVESSMPALIAFKIENGFLVDTQSGMRYCKDASEIAEAIVLAETKQKMGLSKGSGLREAVASNGGF